MSIMFLFFKLIFQELRNELEARTAKLLQFELETSLSAINGEQAPEWVDDEVDDEDGDGFRSRMNRKGEFCNSLLPISRMGQQATVGGVDLHLRTELQRLKMRRTVQCQCQPFSPPANKDGCRIDTIVLTIDHINVNVSFSILISDDLKKMPWKGLFVCRSNNFLENCKFSQQDNDILQIGWDLLATPWPSFCTSSTFHWSWYGMVWSWSWYVIFSQQV